MRYFDIKVTYKWIPPENWNPVKTLGTGGNGQQVILVYRDNK